jgi:hypothetical protein
MRTLIIGAVAALLAFPPAALSVPAKGSTTTARGQAPALADHCQAALQQSLHSCSKDYPQGTPALRACVAHAQQVAQTCESIGIRR